MEPIDQIRKLYHSFPERIAQARKKLGRPMTLAEKILAAHATDLTHQGFELPSVAPNP